MSDTNRVGKAYTVESVYGVTPSGPPTFKNLRWVNQNFQQKTGSIQSQEVNATRNISDLIRTELSVTGSLQAELSYNAYDDLYEYGFLANATWPAAVDLSVPTGTNSITVAASGSNFTLTIAGTTWSAVGSGINSPADLYKSLRFAGFTTGLIGNNGYVKIVSVAGAVLTVSGLAMAVGVQSAGSVTIRKMSQIVTGTTLKSVTIEESFGDLASTFILQKGMCVDALGLDVSVGAVVKANFDFLGKVEVATTTTAGTGTNTAAPVFNVMNTIDNITGVIQGGVLLPITKFSMNLKNNLRQRQQVGTLGPISIGTGSIEITGSLEAYFDATNKALMDIYRAFTPTTLSVIFVDASANAYVLDLPQLKFSDGKVVGGGLNTDVMMSFQYQAYGSPTELISARLSRSTAP